MREIIICVGSSCHLKGAESVVEIFKAAIAEYSLEDIKLSASFCQGNCTEGVNIEIDGQKISAVNKENAMAVFKEHLLPDSHE